MPGIIKRLSLSVLGDSLQTICTSFVRTHLAYADIIYGKPGNVNFKSKLEGVQYNACSAIRSAIRGTNRDSISAIRGTNRDSIYAELGLESLSARRWYRDFLFFLPNSTRPFSSLPGSLPPAYPTSLWYNIQK